LLIFFYSGGIKNTEEKLPNCSGGERKELSRKGLLINLLGVCTIYKPALKKSLILKILGVMAV